MQWARVRIGRGRNRQRQKHRPRQRQRQSEIQRQRHRDRNRGTGTQTDTDRDEERKKNKRKDAQTNKAQGHRSFPVGHHGLLVSHWLVRRMVWVQGSCRRGDSDTGSIPGISSNRSTPPSKCHVALKNER